MRVISTTGSRIINVVLRYTQVSELETYHVCITNDNTRQVVDDEVTRTLTDFTNNNGQFSYTITDNYNEGDELTLLISQRRAEVDTVWHRNKIFVTDQMPQNYNING